MVDVFDLVTQEKKKPDVGGDVFEQISPLTEELVVRKSELERNNRLFLEDIRKLKIEDTARRLGVSDKEAEFLNKRIRGIATFDELKGRELSNLRSEIPAFQRAAQIPRRLVEAPLGFLGAVSEERRRRIITGITPAQSRAASEERLEDIRQLPFVGGPLSRGLRMLLQLTGEVPTTSQLEELEATRRVLESGEEFILPSENPMFSGLGGKMRTKEGRREVAFGIASLATLGVSQIVMLTSESLEDFPLGFIKTFEEKPGEVLGLSLIAAPVGRAAFRGIAPTVREMSRLGVRNVLKRRIQTASQKLGFTSGPRPIIENAEEAALRTQFIETANRMARPRLPAPKSATEIVKQAPAGRKVDALATSFKQIPFEEGNLQLAHAKSVTDPLLRSTLSTPAQMKGVEVGLAVVEKLGIKRNPKVSVSSQVLEAFTTLEEAEQAAMLGTLKDELTKRNMSMVEFMTAWKESATPIARELGARSLITKRMAKLPVEIQEIMEKSLKTFSPWQQFRFFSQRFRNVWRGMLVSQLPTAIRNLSVTAIRFPLVAIDEVLDSVLQKMLFTPNVRSQGLRAATERALQVVQASGTVFKETSKEVLRRMTRGKFVGEPNPGIKLMEDVIKQFPNETESLFTRYASDVERTIARTGQLRSRFAKGLDSVFTKAEQGVTTLNIFNSSQEFTSRKISAFLRLQKSLEKRGLNLENINLQKLQSDDLVRFADDLTDAVEFSLNMTFANTPKSVFGRNVVDLFNKIPIVNYIQAFPRFMVLSWEWVIEHSPANLLKLLSKKEFDVITTGLSRGQLAQTPRRVRRLLQRNTKELSKAIMGTGMLLSAWKIRSDPDIAGEKWFEIKVGEDPDTGESTIIDARPFAPLATYLFLAEVARKAIKGESLNTVDLTQGIFSANFRAGAGLFLLDNAGDIMDEVRAAGSPAEAAKVLSKTAGGRFVGEVGAGFLTPLNQFIDVISQFDKEEATIRDRRDDPIIDPFIAKIPFLRQILPKAQRPIGKEKFVKELPALRVFTGLIFRTKTAATREKDRLGFRDSDISPRTGIPDLDRKMAEAMRPKVEETISRLLKSPFYQELDDLEKRIVFNTNMKEIRKLAREEVFLKNPRLEMEFKLRRKPRDIRKLIDRFMNQEPLVQPGDEDLDVFDEITGGK